ncbi:MAG: LptF/LptG family permease [Myxococcales bacterium]|nr:LptF/LptG family permease [Myxococcales bacterium]
MRRLLAELVAHTALVLAAVLLLLLAGQLAQIGDLLWGAGAAAPWAAVLGRGALILLEAALPLAGLVGAGLVYGRLRSEGAWVAHAALGGHPLGALGPAVAVGGALAVAAAGLAHRVVPDAVAGLRVELVAAAGAALQAPDRVVALPGAGWRRAPGGAWWAVVPGAGAMGGGWRRRRARRGQRVVAEGAARRRAVKTRDRRRRAARRGGRRDGGQQVRGRGGDRRRVMARALRGGGA